MPPRWQPSPRGLHRHCRLPARRRARGHCQTPAARTGRVRPARAVRVVRPRRGLPDAARAGGPSCSHIANNHPLPDANKRAAFLLTARFLDANGLTWRAPDVHIDAGMVEASPSARRPTTRSSTGSANVRAKMGMSPAVSPDTRSTAVARRTAVSIASGSDLPMAATPGGRQLRARLCRRSQLVTRAVRSTVRSVAGFPPRPGPSDTSEDPDGYGIYGTMGQRDPATHQVEGLVRGFPGGGSSPLRRIGKSPAGAGLFRPGHDAAQRPRTDPNNLLRNHTRATAQRFCKCRGRGSTIACAHRHLTNRRSG